MQLNSTLTWLVDAAGASSGADRFLAELGARLIADDVPLKASGQPSTPLPDEDEDFTRYVWTKAVAGATAAQCESSIATDSYRVRRLLAHWVEEGALAAAS